MRRFEPARHSTLWPAKRTTGMRRSLHPHLAAQDALVELRVERQVAALAVEEEQRVGDPGRIEAVVHQLDLAVLEGAGRLDLGRETQEQRPRVGRQLALHVP